MPQLSVVPPFDPREQPVRVALVPVEPCTPARAQRALSEMHEERRNVIKAVAQTDPKMAVKMLLRFYGNSEYVCLAYAELSEEAGYATALKELHQVIQERSGR